ncbi:hypothetical protein PFICI_11480 [Pestalotiopsis fici W106-1]|uniref:Uncharacterized protein n=1 Tax=Pestalotiopsis fici (strain W106-1 / CGMCC3.15140) TaxID=1229662 RepID=W3WQG5_PESFW|nr:uncharacterized protein PFICI_11480 [Pestalotiopsis fici W106-1]ETS76093.1 hypothetical protein PFICI_11480 [Pestalotiopsis fici W106-1]
MSRIFFSLLALAASAVAGDYGQISGWRESALDQLNPKARDAIIQANHNPTATRSVAFKPFEKYWGSLAENSKLRDSEWMWRINISDVSIPDADLEDVDEPHVASAIYDFQFTGTNLSEALDGADGTFCMATLTSIDLPVEIINKYTDDDDSTDCEPILGKSCIDSLLLAGNGATTISDDGNSCIPPRYFWSELLECSDSIGKATVFSTLYGDYPLSGVNRQNNATSSPLVSGQGFFVNVSEPLNGSLSDGYLQSVNRLHVLMINTRIPTDYGFVGGPELHCMRVNATELPENDADGDGDAMTSENIRNVGTSITDPFIGCVMGVFLTLVVCLGVL